jgi:subtilase family serine protease
MSLTSHRLFTPLLVACVSTLGFALPLSSTAGAAQARVVVAGTSPLPASARVVSTPVSAHFDVALASKDPVGLATFLDDLTTATSPLYRHFLTPTRFAHLFGASAATLRSVRTYLEAYGLHVRTLNSAHTLLAMSGSTTQIARAFATPVESVRLSNGTVRAQFTRAATLPAALAREVVAVAGLSSVVSPHSQLAAPRATSHLTSPLPKTCPGASSSGTSSPNSSGGYTVQQQAQLYGLSNAWAAGKTGAGQTIALYELGQYHAANVTSFFSCYGLSPSISTVNVDGGTTGPYSDEATMDIEAAGALAPGAALEVYQTANTSTDPVDLYARIASDDTASIVSTSWGDCEIDPTGDVAAEQVIFEQMAAQGQTVIAAAGDEGSSDCTGIVSNAPSVDDPASQPFVTGVGGLSVTSISPLSETVWNSHGGAKGGASGGGTSQIWSRPSWQVAPGISASATMRLVPDLSVMGDPNTGFMQYYTDSTSSCQGWCAIGGTSIGAPLVSALVATAAQVCDTSRLGFIDPTLYSLARASTGFVDVTTGSNDLLGTGVYSAGPGYDMASGLGSPSTALVDDLCPSTVSVAHSSLISVTKVSYASVASHLVVALRDANGNPVVNSAVTVIAKAAKGIVSIDADPASIKARGAALESVTSDTAGDAAFTLNSSNAEVVSLTIKLNGVVLYTSDVSFHPLPLTLEKPVAPNVTGVAARHRAALITVAPRRSDAPFVVALQVSIDGGVTWRSYPGRTTSIVISGLKGRTTYVVRLRARNANGVSPLSHAFRVTTLR